MPQGGLDRDQVHAAQVELAGAEMAKDVRSDHVGPVGQVRPGGLGQRRAECLVADPGCGAIGVLAFGRQQRDTWPGVVVAELAPHVLDEPAQRLTCVVDQRDHPLTGPGPAGSLAVTDMELAEPAQVPLDVGQVELAGLIDPQPDLRQQTAGGVVAGGRGELPAGRQFFAPSGEQPAHLVGGGRDPEPGLLPAARPVHLVDRALDDPAGHLVDLGLVTELEEQEVSLERLGP
jgi:hypothetical protein